MIGRKLYLASTELRDYPERHLGTVEEVVSRGARRTKALRVRLEPPFPKAAYGTAQDVREVFLVPRHKGETLEESTNWPIHVYIVLPDEDGKLQTSPADWGLVEVADGVREGAS